MIHEFDKEFPDLIVPDDGSGLRQLRTPDEEYMSFPEVEINNITLFLYSQKEPGFVERWCFRQGDQDKLADMRKKMDKNPDLLMNVVLVLERYLSMSYEKFSKLDIFDQSQLIEKAKLSLSDEDKELFYGVFKDLTTKYKTMGLKPDETESK